MLHDLLQHRLHHVHLGGIRVGGHGIGLLSQVHSRRPTAQLPTHLPDLYHLLLGGNCLSSESVPVLYCSSSSLTLVLIVQFRRYRRHHRAVPDGTQPTEGIDMTAPFATGGCCSCCVGDDDDRCCCCYCACCEPKGIQASYILGDELPPQEERVSDDMSDFGVGEGRCCHDDNSGESESHCHCCCNRKESVIEMTTSPSQETQQHEEETQPAQQPHNPPSEFPEENTPTVYLSSSIQLPAGETHVLHDVRLVRAVADDGSGKTVLIALPFPVCCCT